MRRLTWVLIGLAGVAVAIQAVPYGRTSKNPPVAGEPNWDSDRTRDLFFRACADCHSNETDWPWYARIAPASWLMTWDVDEARSHFNVSEWGRKGNHGDEAAELVSTGEMPLWYYLPAHPEARLTESERAQLVAGLERTFGSSEPESSGDGHGNARGTAGPSKPHEHDHGAH